jgi:osmotically-inducible protein OsmY
MASTRCFLESNNEKPQTALAASALVIGLPFLAGCVPAVIATGATVGVMSAQDRRSTGVQTDDEVIEWKAAQSVPERYAAAAHVNFTSFNQRLLITGEVPSEEARTAIGQQAAQVARRQGGVQRNHRRPRLLALGAQQRQLPHLEGQGPPGRRERPCRQPMSRSSPNPASPI